MIDLSTVSLKDLEDIIGGYEAITFDEFCAVLRQTNGADRQYCQGVWAPFQDMPIRYCRSRQPRTQGERLTALALEKAQARRAKI